ncbi:MAG: hypothetical protein LBG94_04665 [Treponema sp.]|jgi:hypothetical protein|nr:hypothetical protein [Treponema sp.]
MIQKKDELKDFMWISRFWAIYSKLPETLKEGFISLVESVKKCIEEEGKEKEAQFKDNG